jgi:pimeloyl-ACP methyl ester carboxylesterase
VSSSNASRRQFLRGAIGLSGGLWLSRALPVAAQTGSQVRRPLILVHGFADQTATWLRSDNALVARLAAAGYRWEPLQLVPFAYPGLAQQPEVEDSQGDIAAAGLLLANQIRRLAGQAASGQVDLLGFSMGGLVCRWALAHLRERSGRPLVNTAVLVAAPNAGVDILVTLQRLSAQTQAGLYELARELIYLDLESTGVQQMLPGSSFLQQLNDPARSDERVRHLLIAATLQLTLQVGPFLTNLELGDGLISLVSAGWLPTQARHYEFPEQLAGESLRAALLGAEHLHPRLILHHDVGLIAAHELAPSTTTRRELEANLASGSLRVLEPI